MPQREKGIAVWRLPSPTYACDSAMPACPKSRLTPSAGAFESLSNQITELSSQMRNVIVGQRIQLGLLLLVAAAILAPYIAAWGDMTG